MANDIIDINVYESTETVEITVNPNLTTVNINKVAGGGSGVTNLSTTQTASNFTINSDTGDDAIVPLGNGTLAGATLNDYTTAEKNKLTAITGTNTGDQNLQSVTNLGNAIVLPSNKNKGIDITIADLQNQYSNGITVTLEPQTGTYSNNDAFVAIIKGQNPNTLPFRVFGFSTITTGADNQSFVSEHNAGTISSEHYVASNASGITSDFAFFNTNYVNVFKIDYLGNTTAEKFIKQGGTASQILAADGSVITAGNNITITGGQISSVGGAGGGGSSVNYYLNGGTSQGTFGGSTYYEFSKTAIIGTGADFNINTNGYIASFITDVADPSLLLIPAGNWNLEFFFSSSSAGGSPSFYVELYKYDGTTFTLIASNSATPEGITGGTSIDAYFTPLAVPETILTVNDRLAIRVFVNVSSKTITLHTQNGHLCEVITTFTSGLTALNGLQAQVQNFATGTTGTDFDINSSGSTHTFNLPSASETARGVVTTGTQTFGGAKTFTSIGSTAITGNSTEQAGITGTSVEGTGIVGTSIDDVGVYGGSTNAIGGVFNTENGTTIVEFQTNSVLKATVNSDGTFAGTGLNASGQTINTIASFDANKNVVSLPTATYPSLTELTYAKGVTSGIQTQLDNKIAKNVATTYTTNTITTVTAAEYAAIGTKDANTLYFIV